MMEQHVSQFIDINDRGLAYGDGLFETIACIKDHIHNWDLHWQRLQAGCQRLQIDTPKENLLKSRIEEQLNRQKEQNRVHELSCVVKIIVTRGCGGRGYQFPQPQTTTLLILLHPWPQRLESDYKNGIDVVVCDTALAQQPRLAGIKHLNRLEQVLARNEFDFGQFQDGLMLEFSKQLEWHEKKVIEATSSNLFFVINGKLCTPEIDNCGIRGTIREFIISSMAGTETEVEKGEYPLSALQHATEVFLTNSVFGVVPVASISCKGDTVWCYGERTFTRKVAELVNYPLGRPLLSK